MAPVPPAHLDLAQYLKGDQQLITWEAVYNALCDPKTAAKSQPLRDFLTSDENVAILSSPWQPFPKPSAQEKAKFDSATAPISITPAESDHYNLTEIKEDSLWLSKEAQISEHAALRLAVQEWQTRPMVQLMGGLTEEEVLSVKEAAGVNNLGASTFMPNLSILTTPTTHADQTSAHFDSFDQRRLRLIGIYFSTCNSILRVSQLLTSWGAARDLRTRNPSYPNDYRVCDDRLEQLGQAIVAKQNDKTGTQSDAPGLDRCIMALRERIDAHDNGCWWSVPESIESDAAVQWALAQTTQMIHLLHLALFYVDVHATGLLPSSSVDLWFRTLGPSRYLKDFAPNTPEQIPMVAPIQALVSIISVAILKSDLVFDGLDNGDFQEWPAAAYPHDAALLERLTMAFSEAVDLGPSPVLPAAFAWASIVWRLVFHENMTEKSRELQSESAQSRYRRSRIDDAILHLSRLDASEEPFYSRLGVACLNLDVLSISEKLLGIAMTNFGSPIDQISRDRFRFTYLHIVRTSLHSGVLEFGGVLSLACQILIGDRTPQDWIARAEHHADPVVTFVRGDEAILKPILLESAIIYHPQESDPLLRFFSAFVRGEGAKDMPASSAFDELMRIPSVTQQLPPGPECFRSEQEEMNENRAALTVDLPQFIQSPNSAFPNHRRLLNGNSAPAMLEFMVIEAGTRGVILDFSDTPYVARWKYPHSALEYFYHLLSTYVMGSTKVVYATQQPASTVDAARIIELFADIMHSSLHASRARGDGNTCPVDVLAALSIGAEYSPDTVTLVLSIFEEELLRQHREPANEGSLHLLVVCTYFLQALVKVAPNRVWPWIARSRLLDIDGNGGSLASVLIGTEMVFGSYKFLIGCIHLFQELVNNAVESSVSRKSSNSNKVLTRFNASSSLESGTSEKAMSATLLNFGKMLASVYETSLGWKYNSPDDRLHINTGICEAFTSILEVTYEVDDSPDLTGKLSSIIAPIANYITDLYLSPSKNDLSTNPILSSLLSGTDLIKSTTFTSAAALSKHQTRATLTFSDLLVRIAILLEKPWTHLEQQLFKATPLLARLYVTSEEWKPKVVALLETLVRGAVRVSEVEIQAGEGTPKKREHTEAPSLLGHLGSSTAKNFMIVLAQLDEPMEIADIQEGVWNLLTAVVTCKQRWFALYLLTGSTPREMMRNKSKTATRISASKSLLSRAFDALAHIDLQMPNPPWNVWIAMLEFITSAQNYWSWAMGDLRQRKDFIGKLVNFLKWMSHQHPPVVSDAITRRSQENKFTALVSEVLAMYLHSARQAGDTTSFKDVIAGLSYLQDNALKLPEYNVNLHSNLKRNFEQKFAGVKLASFKHTTLYPQPYGSHYFYDVSYASHLLEHDRQWSGPSPGQGFRAEVERANRNLSLVDSQILLLQSWRLLALELSYFATKDPRVTTCLIDVVQGCMKANADLSLPEALFGQLAVLRADLAFALLKRLVEDRVRSEEARLLLGSVWAAIRAAIPDFELVFESQGLDYYRSLLRILYLTLHFYLISPSDNVDPKESAFRSSFRGTIMQPKNDDDAPINISLQLLEILSDTVASGFRSLVNQLHSNPQSVSPSDFALLTALLQRIIAIPEMATSQSQIALLLANNNVSRTATTLFSWSDQLLVDTSGSGPDDPLYGELSVLFLVTLSSLKQLAEPMAVEGVLAQLNASNLMAYFRKPGGMSPFDKPPRLHAIWTKGILPLCLNLLLAVGPPIAGEIASFLNAFPEQLGRSAEALNSKLQPRITLGIAAETHSLALISRIIEDVRSAGVSVGVQPGQVSALEWDRENVKEDVEGWVGSLGALEERIVGDGSEGYTGKVVEEIRAAGGCLGVNEKNGN